MRTLLIISSIAWIAGLFLAACVEVEAATATGKKISDYTQTLTVGDSWIYEIAVPGVTNYKVTFGTMATNIIARAGGGGGNLVTNANQFGPSTTLTLKNGLLATNPTFYGSVTLPGVTALRPAFINGAGIITNVSGTPTGSLFVRDDGVLATPASAVAAPISSVQFNSNGVQRGGNWSITNRHLINPPTVAGRGAQVIGMGTASEPVAVFGYNHLADYTLAVTNEPGMAWIYEGDYNDGSGTNKTEAYLQYLWPDNSGKYSRPFMVQWNKTNNLPLQTSISGGSGSGQGIGFYLNAGIGTIGSSEFVIGTNVATIASNGFALNLPIITALDQKYAIKGAGSVDHFTLESSDTVNPFQFIISRGSNASGLYFTLESVESGVAGRNLILNAQGGRVAIGNTTPQTALSVTTSGDNYAAQFGEAGSTTGKKLCIGYFVSGDYGIIEAFHAGTGYKNLALNPNGGNVGIGTTTPAAKLDVPGEGRFGSLKATGAVVFAAASSVGQVPTFRSDGSLYPSNIVSGTTTQMVAAAIGTLTLTNALSLTVLNVGTMNLTNALGSNVARMGYQDLTNIIRRQTFFAPAGYMISNSTDGALFSTLESSPPTNRMSDRYTFSGVVTNVVGFDTVMPLNWDLGTLKVKLWTISTNNLATTTNVWAISAVAIQHGSMFTNVNWGTEVTWKNVVSSAGGQELLTPASTAVTVGSSPAAAGNHVYFRIRRLPGHADDNDGGQQNLLGAWVQYGETMSEVASW